MKKIILLTALVITQLISIAQTFKLDTISSGGSMIAAPYVDTTATNWVLSKDQIHDNILYFMASKSSVYEFDLYNDNVISGEIVFNVSFRNYKPDEYKIYCTVRVAYIAGKFKIVLSSLSRDFMKGINTPSTLKLSGQFGEDERDIQSRIELVNFLKDMSFFVSKRHLRGL